MVGISVAQYNTPYNMNILQQSTKTNNNQHRDVIIIRKPSQTLEGKECANNILNGRKKVKCGKETSNPPPIAVARRNARERNRVKQVNNGFATLRQHIPNSIAASFESNSGRGGNKKLSKVETLRMAVEYIRSLEDILASNDNDMCGNISSASNFMSYPSPAPSSPTMTSATNLGYNYPLKLSPGDDDDDLSTNSTPSSPQYIRINNSNAYQIIETHLYDNSENLEPLDDQIVSDPTLIHAADLEFGDVQDLSLLNSMHSGISMSPDIYSESSRSPSSIDKSGAQTFLPVIHARDLPTPTEDVKFNPSDMKDVVHPVISLHTTMQISQDHKENMLHVMAWWEQQQNSSS